VRSITPTNGGDFSAYLYCSLEGIATGLMAALTVVGDKYSPENPGGVGPAVKCPAGDSPDFVTMGKESVDSFMLITGDK
jgi:hypothetical protein